MEADILKHFIGKDVEILVSGVWIEGRMQPIAKGVVTLLPAGEMNAFYGPAACKADVIMAIRQIKQPGTRLAEPLQDTNPPPMVRSSLEQVTPTQRFKRDK